MNPNQLLNIFGRQLLRGLIRGAMAIGITKGVGYLARRGKDPEQMTGAERKQAKKMSKNSQEAIKRIRQVSRITRRFR